MALLHKVGVEERGVLGLEKARLAAEGA